MSTPDQKPLTARERLVALTLHGASMAQEVTSQVELERARRGVMDRVESLVLELRSALATEVPAAAGMCAGDAHLLAAGSIPAGQGRALLAEACLAEQMQVQFLLARQEMPMPGPLLVKMYALALKS